MSKANWLQAWWAVGPWALKSREPQVCEILSLEGSTEPLDKLLSVLRNLLCHRQLLTKIGFWIFGCRALLQPSFRRESRREESSLSLSGILKSTYCFGTRSGIQRCIPPPELGCNAIPETPDPFFLRYE